MYFLDSGRAGSMQQSFGTTASPSSSKATATSNGTSRTKRNLTTLPHVLLKETGTAWEIIRPLILAGVAQPIRIFCFLTFSITITRLWRVSCRSISTLMAGGVWVGNGSGLFLLG